jgi:putative protease
MMIELLAPAGSREAFTAALECGADAIYLGGQQFGARQYASNFDRDELARSIRQAHLMGVRVYITVNTLVDDTEMPALREYIRYLYEVGADAAILQDVGVARVVRKVAPRLPIHASTQMTVHDLPGVNLLADYGFDRVILARELSMDEIANICSKARCHVETFIHGALCICYSGQCLMSSLIGGRSGNRGRCAQPCRLPYHLTDEKDRDVLSGLGIGEYLLSPKDFQTIEIMPEYIKAGVASLKIEGRMKRPEYVAVVVDAYRRAIDRSYADPQHYQTPAEDLRDLEQIFNRGFTTAHLFGKNSREMMSDRRPNNRGVLIGRVVRYLPHERQMILKLEGPLAVGDIVEAWVKVGGRVNVEVREMLVDEVAVSESDAHQEVAIPCQEQVRPGDRVFKTFDSRLTDKARSWFAKPYARRRLPVTMTVWAAVGLPMKIEIRDRDGNLGTAETQQSGQAARNRPLTQESLENQCSRLGNTPFGIEAFSALIDGEVMVPVSEINDARRRAAEQLESARLAAFDRPPLPIMAAQIEVKGARPPLVSVRDGNLTPELVVKIDTIEQAQAALNGGADWLMLSGERFHGSLYQLTDYEEILSVTRKAGKRIIFGLPRIVRDCGNMEVTQRIDWFAQLGPDAVSVATVGTLARVKEYPGLKIHADYPLNLFNSEALEFIREQGAASATLSPELTMLQVQKLGQASILPLECLVHGRITLMISEFCALGAYLGERDGNACIGACRQGEYRLQDRKGEFFPVVSDDACRMHILNGKELSMLPHVPRFAQAGIARIRMEACHMQPDDIMRIAGLYRRGLDNGAQGLPSADIEAAEHDDITRGHYFRGVL